jgi:hypothetical protein
MVGSLALMLCAITAIKNDWERRRHARVARSWLCDNSVRRALIARATQSVHRRSG